MCKCFDPHHYQIFLNNIITYVLDLHYLLECGKTCYMWITVLLLQVSSTISTEHFLPHSNSASINTFTSELSVKFNHLRLFFLTAQGWNNTKKTDHMHLLCFHLFACRSLSQKSLTHCFRGCRCWSKVMTEPCWTAMRYLPPWQPMSWASPKTKCE